MFLDFEDYRPDTPRLDRAISWREGVMLSIIVHLLVVVAFLLGPEIPWVRAAMERAREAALAKQLEIEKQQRDNRTFVFVQPRLDMPSKLPPPPRADYSDQDRQARTRERAPVPDNTMPFAQGNTRERIESAPEQRARGQGPQPEPSPPQRATAPPTPAAPSENTFTQQAPRREPQPQSPEERPASPAGGSLGEALKNLEKYTQNQTFDNRTGGLGEFGPAIQFDTKGVEFGPWIRRFVAQIKRNWFIPYAAMSLRGHVVLTFNVHKDGRITDLTILQPSNVDAFNNAAFNAMLASNPTQPLPPEYPSDRAFFTVTFYYNETPPSGY